MATNTNYTTKTAALKATKADMRQVAVSKKLTSKEVWVDDAEGVSTNVLELIGDAQSAATSAASGALSAAKTELEGKINQAAENAAISVGRDANKDWKVDASAIDSVKKINFLGDYVNVVPGSNGEISLYIGENKSLEEANKKELKDTPSNSTSVIVYDDGNITLPVAAGSSTTAYSVVNAGSTFSSATMTAKGDTTAAAEFTLTQAENIWVRTTYEGTTSSWGKVSLKKARGVSDKDTETENVYTTSLTSFVADTTSTDDEGNLLYDEIALPDGVSMQVANYTLDTKNAKDGKIPGRCQTKFTITVNYNTIATKRGGTILLEWIIAEALEGGTAPVVTTSAPTNKISVFVTEKKTPVLANYDGSNELSVTVSEKKVEAVSGLYYATKNSTINVSTGALSDSQFKSATTDTRLVIACAGGSTTLKINDLELSDADVTAGKTKTSSGVTYKGANNVAVTLGSTYSNGTNGQINVTATPYGYSYGTAKKISNLTALNPWWGDVSKNKDSKSSDGDEEFWVKEYARYKDITAQTTFGSTLNVLENGVTIKGTETVGAVAQYGELMHPDAAVAALDSAGNSFKYPDTTKAASYIRKFSGLTAGAGFKITGTNIGASGIKVYWYDDLGLNDLVDISVPNAYNTISTNSITHSYDGPNGEKATTAPIIVIVIPHGSTTKIGSLKVEKV